MARHSGKHMGNFPCPSCGSKDNLGVYEKEDGTYNATCWGCRTFYSQYNMEGDNVQEDIKDTVDNWDTPDSNDPLTYQFGNGIDRGIPKGICESFGVRKSCDPDGNDSNVYYPYHRDKTLTGWKVRSLPKTFFSEGDIKDTDLFGQHLFPGTGKQLVITEGEEDCLAVAAAYQKHYDRLWPVVSLTSAGNHKALIKNLDWIKGFESVVLYLDADPAGESVIPDLARIIGFDKIRVASGKEKDASAEWVGAGYMGVLRAIWDSSIYSPVGILGAEDLWSKVEDYNSIESIPYPECLGGLNSKLKGMRKGEITLWTSGTGTGKSTILREIATHLLETTDEKIGIISLEESPAETARKLSGMAINRNPANEEIPLEDLKIGFDKIFGDDRVLVLDHAGAITDDSVITQLEYMAAMGCSYLFVDHITILVSEGTNGLTGNEATDAVMNGLLKVSKQHNVWIGLISHLRKMQITGKSFEDGVFPSLDDIRGSGSIKQISHDIIAFARDMCADSIQERNTIRMRVLKSRYTGLTGNSGGCIYDIETGRLNNSTVILDKEDF